MDPMLTAAFIIIGAMYGYAFYDLGMKMVWICLLGIALGAIVFGVGYLLYKAIAFAQSKCEERQ